MENKMKDQYNDINIDAEIAWAMWETCKSSIGRGKWTQRQKELDEERWDEYHRLSVDELMALFDLEHIIMTYDIDWRIK
jgi:hypothetical protein